MLGFITAAMYSGSGEQVRAKILTLPLAKPSVLTLAAGQRGTLTYCSQVTDPQGGVRPRGTLFQITQG